ncbi:MAG: MFS transporter [Lachnospiraceae bacterium]|nr:MFS transporter [Lachnospiraceae bacterium]
MSTTQPNYKRTLYAGFIGYIVQAIVNNFIPLLFLTFHDTYGISLSHITMLITFNFAIQLLVDSISAGFIDKIGYKVSFLLAHVFAVVGFICLTFLPDIMPSPFVGLLISVIIYAVGGGLLEVLVSPIVEALPTDNKEKTMSLLHSFYCWGHVAVVLLSTLFFHFAGTEHWKIMSLIWALIPLFNIFMLWNAPIYSLLSEDEVGYTLPELMKKPIFWLMLMIMICAGASEQAVSQWASTFAERGLQVSKTIGDLTGPMFFAVLMGSSRLIYGKYGDKINLKKAMLLSTLLCIGSYLLIALAPTPALSLLGCGLCGFSVGILWPGAFSIAAASLKRGGTLLFALLALAGDLGCSGGPTFVGLISGAFHDNLNIGILSALVFPICMVICLLVIKNRKQL